ncbi:hypothetical protein RUND412_011412 [Rhizina undulata]
MVRYALTAIGGGHPTRRQRPHRDARAQGEFSGPGAVWGGCGPRARWWLPPGAVVVVPGRGGGGCAGSVVVVPVPVVAGAAVVGRAPNTDPGLIQWSRWKKGVVVPELGGGGSSSSDDDSNDGAASTVEGVITHSPTPPRICLSPHITFHDVKSIPRDNDGVTLPSLPGTRSKTSPGYPASTAWKTVKDCSQFALPPPPKRPRISQRANKEFLSADRNNKATLPLTTPRRTIKSSAKDLSPPIVKLQSADEDPELFRKGSRCQPPTIQGQRPIRIRLRCAGIRIIAF